MENAERWGPQPEAWSVAGEADAIARVRTADNTSSLIMELQRDGHVERTRSQVVMSQLISRAAV